MRPAPFHSALFGAGITDVAARNSASASQTPHIDGVAPTSLPRPPPSPPPSPSPSPPLPPPSADRNIPAPSLPQGVAPGTPPEATPERLWALKAVAVLSPWPFHAFWREYLYELLCMASTRGPLDQLLKQISLPAMIAMQSASSSAEFRRAQESTLLPLYGGVPSEQIGQILLRGGPSTNEATRLIAASTLWARLPNILIVCTTPSVNAAATIAATSTPIVDSPQGATCSQTSYPIDPDVSCDDQPMHESAEVSALRMSGLQLFSSTSWTPAGLQDHMDAETGSAMEYPLPMMPSRLVHAQRQHCMATVSQVISSVPSATLSLLLASLAAGWSAFLYSRDPMLLSHVCSALLLAFKPLRWLGACLPCVPRSGPGMSMLSRLRLASEHVPMLVGVVQPAHDPFQPPSTPTTQRTLHVLLPDGRPLWRGGEDIVRIYPACKRAGAR